VLHTRVSGAQVRWRPLTGRCEQPSVARTLRTRGGPSSRDSTGLRPFMPAGVQVSARRPSATAPQCTQHLGPIARQLPDPTPQSFTTEEGKGPTRNLSKCLTNRMTALACRQEECIVRRQTRAPRSKYSRQPKQTSLHDATQQTTPVGAPPWSAANCARKLRPRLIPPAAQWRHSPSRGTWPPAPVAQRKQKVRSCQQQLSTSSRQAPSRRAGHMFSAQGHSPGLRGSPAGGRTAPAARP
jgi:hypothetical protein